MQGTNFSTEKFGLDGEILDAARCYDPFIDVAQDERVEDLTAVFEARKRRLRGKSGAIPTLHGETLWNPQLTWPSRTTIQLVDESVEARRAFGRQKVPQVFANQVFGGAAKETFCRRIDPGEDHRGI